MSDKCLACGAMIPDRRLDDIRLCDKCLNGIAWAAKMARSEYEEKVACGAIKPKPEPELPKSACSSCGSHAWMEDGSGWRCACGVLRLGGVSFSEKKPEPAKLEPSAEAVEALRSELSTYTDGMKDMIMKRCKECHQPTLNEPPICLSCYCRMNHPVRKEPEDYKTLYHELVMSVARAYPGETLHQTALRYIQQAETGTSGEASQTKKEKPQ